MSTPRKKNKRVERFVIGLIVLALLVAMGVQILRLKGRADEQEKELANLEREYAAETQRAEELQRLEEYMRIDNPQYIEDLAKSKLGLAYENEIIFKESDE